jgi:hypothetical protein
MNCTPAHKQPCPNFPRFNLGQIPALSVKVFPFQGLTLENLLGKLIFISISIIIKIMKKATFYANLPVSVLREGRKFIVYTPALDLSTSGKNYEEAKKRFREIVSIFFEELLRKGTLGGVLRDLGWQRVRARWVPPVVISQELESLCIPVRL